MRSMVPAPFANILQEDSDMKALSVAVLACIGLGVLVLPAAAQQPQPGSSEYNSVYLPAHGVGDTRRGPPAVR